MEKICVRILSDACAAIQSSSCLPIRNRCKQTLYALFLSETIIVSFTGLRQLNTKLYSIFVAALDLVWIYRKIYICLPRYWFLFFFCSWTSAVRDIDLLLASNFLRFFFFCLPLCVNVCEALESKNTIVSGNLCCVFHDIQIEFTMTSMKDSDDQSEMCNEHQATATNSNWFFSVVFFISWSA